jgi:hypothetical protein
MSSVITLTIHLRRREKVPIYFHSPDYDAALTVSKIAVKQMKNSVDFGGN